MNITKCPKCHYSLIEEEVSNHICKEIMDYRIEGDTVYFFDGILWYPAIKLIHKKTTRSDGFFHREDPDGDFTMPMKDGFKYHIRFLMDR